MLSLKALQVESAPAKFQTVNNMKRLFLTLGLVIAFFFTAQINAETIFDSSTYQGPKVESKNEYECNPNMSSKVLITTSVTACIDYAKSFHSISSSYSWGACEPTSPPAVNAKKAVSCQRVFNYDGSSSPVVVGSIFGLPPKESISCPPDNYPNYTFERDTNNDGKTDQCYNPDELDNASNCANQVGSMLPALTNIVTKVCKTDQGSGARCGYSKKDGDVVYKLDLEMNCFGDSENQVPEYNPEPMPEPSNCAKYNDGLMVCKEKPENKCDANGNCQDQCGFFNKEFYCFINCSGEECDKETPPPVNCETNPTAPVCVEEPDPEPDPDFCKNNPTDPKCTTPPEPCTGDNCPPDGGGGGGGTGEKVDLKPVVDELKALNDKLDFSTTQNDSTRKMGLLETAFDDDAISELKSKTDELKTEINGFYTSTKAEISSMFSFSTGGGSYEPITFAFTYGTFSSKIWEYFAQNVAYIAAAIMFLAYLMAARIVLE